MVSVQRRITELFALKYGAQPRKLHRSGRKFLTFLRGASSLEAALAFADFAGAGGRGRPGAGGPAAERRRWRSGSGLAIGLGQTRLADTLLGPRPFPIAGQRAGSGGTSPPPHSDSVSGDPAGRRRPPTPVRTAKTAASVHRPTECCGRSAAPPSPWYSGHGGRSRWRPTTPDATGRSAACRARSARSRRPRPPISRPVRAAEKSCGSCAAMAGAKRCGSRGPGGFRTGPHQAVAVHDPEMIDAVGVGHRSLESLSPRQGARRAARSSRHNARPAAASPTAAATARPDGCCRRARCATRAAAPTA